ncbi:cytochrome P450 [Rhizoctonia solani]|nr:cytochrome P450 [Rhizoctonia solani]
MAGVTTFSCSAFLFSSLVILHLYRQENTSQKSKSIPSPRAFPLIGNIFSIPSGLEHIAYITLGKRLKSDIISLRLFGHNIVILNSSTAASDLLEKRSALYSDRYCPPMIEEPSLLDWTSITPTLGYNDLWRHHRRILNNWLNSRAVIQFHRQQEEQTHILLKRLLEIFPTSQPFDRAKEEIFFSMASSMFRLAYGYRLKNAQDPFFINARLTLHRLAEAAMFTNFFVNVFPSLKYVPTWMPGTSWKRTARQWRADKEQALNGPYEWTKAQIAAGTPEPSIIGALLQGHALTSALAARDLATTKLTWTLGGTDTSSNALIAFIAAMVLHPEVQTKAQAEIDTTLGSTVLPTMSDRDRLPYVNKLIVEVLRWRPILPTALPHMCFQDDVYRGYEIKKGTIVLGNIWAISRDEVTYQDPDVFNPDRFEDPNLPEAPVFGWGRRKCPGIHYADYSLFINIASLLATFTFSKIQGKEAPKIEDSANSAIPELKPFDFEFSPRSEKHQQIILDCIH